MKSKNCISPVGNFANAGCFGRSTRGLVSKELVTTRVRCASLIGTLLAGLVGISIGGCGGGQGRPVTISFPPGTFIVQAGTTSVVDVVVVGLNNSSVDWTLSCRSAASCGAVSPTSTSISNGNSSTTYAAPPTLPASNLNVTLTATLTSDKSKSASATIIVPSVGVSVSPTIASVPSRGNQQFTATVLGDSTNHGVTWSLVEDVACLSIKCGGNFGTHVGPCGSSCGTLSSTNTGSATPVTYTAPAKPPSVQPPSSLTIRLIATSVADTIVSTSASINVLPIAVSVSPTSASVGVNATQQFTATVTNDGTNSGVSWTLTQNGTACSPGCGLIAPASTSSGAAATYTPPATAPALPLLTVTATSVEDTTKSAGANVTLTTSNGSLACGAGSGSESLLKGQYAFLLYGHGLPPMFAGGSFTADGTGKITAGEEDIQANGSTGTDVNINPGGSAYAVGQDHRGCAVLTNANGATLSLRFALGSVNTSTIATAGLVIEFDDTTGKGARASGSIRLQDTTSFSASQFKGNYVFGLVQVDGNGAAAGTLSSDGISGITSKTIDGDFGGTLISGVTSTDSFTCCSANGRGTLDLDTSQGGWPFAIYMINSSDVFLVSDIVDGEAIGIPSGTQFSQSSLSGVSVLRETAQSSSGPVVDIATVSADGKSALTTNDNVNNAGTFNSSSTAFNYAVAANGRVTFTGGTTPPIIYLYGPNHGFLVGTDTNATFGILEPQAAGPFSNALFSGAYIFGTENPSASTVTMESGVVTADGNGNAAGTSDQSSPSGLSQNQSFNFTYSFPANGIGNVGSGTTAILISGNKLVFINNATTNPTITFVEK